MWQPLAADRRDELAAIVDAIVAALDGVPAQGWRDHAERALVRYYLDDGDGATVELERAVEAFARTAASPALFGGAAGIGWVVAHLAGDDATQLAEIDARLLERLPHDYDLLGGVVGIGVYALERGEAGRPIALAVLDALEQRARPRAGGVMWHTAPELLPPWQRELAPDGYWNLGLAHGNPGVIALLARFVSWDIAGERARALLEPALTALLASAPARDGGRFASWQIGDPGEPATDDERERLAWCYGDLGVALALAAAALATGDARWDIEARTVARSCAARTFDAARVDDAAICHGAAGVAHLLGRLGQALGDRELLAAARRWLDRALAMRVDHPLAGFPSRALVDGISQWVADPTILTGAAGVALVLCSMISGTEPAWDRLLLADLPPVD